MMAKHTEGPWRVSVSGKIVLSYYRQIAHMDNTYDAQTEEQLANAQLMAASPDLLDACKKFVDVWNRTGQRVKLDVACRLAEQAIEKATQQAATAARDDGEGDG